MHHSFVHGPHRISERCEQAFDGIKDVIPVANIGVRGTRPQAVRRAVLAPEGRVIETRREGACTVLRLPALDGHPMGALEF